MKGLTAILAAALLLSGCQKKLDELGDASIQMFEEDFFGSNDYYYMEAEPVTSSLLEYYQDTSTGDEYCSRRVTFALPVMFVNLLDEYSENYSADLEVRYDQYTPPVSGSVSNLSGSNNSIILDFPLTPCGFQRCGEYTLKIYYQGDLATTKTGDACYQN